jgi:hypothetical protein
MAKQGKVLPARRQREREEPSVLLRSAESLGRVIGLLQRQLDGASTRVAAVTGLHIETDGSDGSANGNTRPSLQPKRRRAVNGTAKSTAATKAAPTRRKAKSASASAVTKKTPAAKNANRSTATSRKRRGG